MSATGRGREVVEGEGYYSPHWTINVLSDVLDASVEHAKGGQGIRENALSKVRRMVDPMAGDGRILRTLTPPPGMSIVRREGCELREEERSSLVGLDAVTIANCFETYSRPMPDALVATNPAFSLAFQTVEHFSSRAAVTALLLRAGVNQHTKRAAWLSKHPPSYEFTLSHRPVFCWPCNGKVEVRNPTTKTVTFEKCPKSYPPGTTASCTFCGNGKPRSAQDATHYAWMIWIAPHILPPLKIGRRRDIVVGMRSIVDCTSYVKATKGF